jgi:hypothetical protein
MMLFLLVGLAGAISSMAQKQKTEYLRSAKMDEASAES